MHEDIDISLHLMDKDLKTVYSPRIIAAMSATDGYVVEFVPELDGTF